MKRLLEMLQKQDGRYSIARVACVATIFLWWGTWIYTLLLKQSYAHFTEVTTAMLIMFFVVLLGKSIDSKIISVKTDK